MTHVSAIRLPDRARQTAWGSWQLDTETMSLFHLSHPCYAIPLDRINTCAQMLDWIFQVCAKRWVSVKDKADLIEALRSIYDPQGSMCSFGYGRVIDAPGFLKGRFFQ